MFKFFFFIRTFDADVFSSVLNRSDMDILLTHTQKLQKQWWFFFPLNWLYLPF